MNGISFIVRVKNEENVLEESLRSLKGLTTPYDIHVVLNNCTDSSKQIAEKLKDEGFPISIYEYNIPISRAGYELLVTDKDSIHSMTYYTQWCYKKATLPWIFRWDADFILTDKMKDFINNNKWNEADIHTRCYIPAISVDSNSAEHCLFSGPYKVDKYIFWEVTMPTGDVIEMNIDNSYVLHASDLKIKKSYWLSESWFMNSNKPEAIIIREKYNKLIELCGPEPVGSARRANPENNACYLNVRRHENILKQFGINFYT